MAAAAVADPSVFNVKVGKTEYSIDKDTTPEEFFEQLEAETGLKYLAIVKHFRSKLGWSNKAMKPKQKTAFDFVKSLATEENEKTVDLRFKVIESEDELDDKECDEEGN